MADVIATAANAAAERLTASYGPGLLADVQAELRARSTAPARPDRFVDPISVASLIVAIASLAWTVYTDLRKEKPDPPHQAVLRSVRIALRERGDFQQPEAGKVTEIVVSEIIRAADDPH